MGIAISEDHLELAGVADAFLERTGARAEARALLDAPEEALPGVVEGDGRPRLARACTCPRRTAAPGSGSPSS